MLHYHFALKCIVNRLKYMLHALQYLLFDINFYFRVTDKKIHAMNFGSYNYLGFSENKGPCADAVKEVTSIYGTTTCGSRQEMGMFFHILAVS